MCLRRLKLCGNLSRCRLLSLCAGNTSFSVMETVGVYFRKKTKGQISTDCLPHYPSIKAKRKHVVLILHLSYKKETVLVNSLNLKVTHYH